MNQTLIALTPTLEHLAFLLDRATLPTQPRTATNPTNAQHTDTD
jgi:hypothetical protein